MPFYQIYATLDSITSTRAREVILDLNVDMVTGSIVDSFLVGVEGLDGRLCRIAELSVGPDIFTVMLSAPDPCILAGRLGRVRQKGKLVLGTRYRESNVCGEVYWLGEHREMEAA